MSKYRYIFEAMATVKRFEDLFSWKKARELTKFIYSLTKKPNFSKDYGLKNQIERSAVSVVANQAEGFSRGTKMELINYFYIAKGSAGEVQSHLYVALDQQYIDESEFRRAYGLAQESQKLIQSFVDKVKAGGMSGIQHRQTPPRDEGKEQFKEFLKKENKIFTSSGVKTREEAKRLGLEEIEL